MFSNTVVVDCVWTYKGIHTGDAFDATELPNVLIAIVNGYTFAQASQYTVAYRQDGLGFESVHIAFDDLVFTGPPNAVASLKLSEALIIQPAEPSEILLDYETPHLVVDRHSNVDFVHRHAFFRPDERIEFRWMCLYLNLGLHGGRVKTFV